MSKAGEKTNVHVGQGAVNIGGGGYVVCGSLSGIKHGVFTLGHVPQTHRTTRVDPLFVVAQFEIDTKPKEKKTSSVYLMPCNANKTPSLAQSLKISFICSIFLHI